MARANAANGSVRSQAILGVARSVTHPLTARLVRFEPQLKLAIPILVALFTLLVGVAGALHVTSLRDQAARDAIDDVEVIAALVAGDVAQVADRIAAMEQRYALNRLLAPITFAGGRQVVVTNAAGRVVASEPAVDSGTRTLADLLGPAQPLTTFAEKAGAMLVQAPKGPLIAAVRNLPAPLGQIAVAQPLHAALSPATATGRTVIVLLGAAMIVLAILTLAFLAQTGRAHAADVDCQRVSDRIDAALNSGRCGLWDWDLARGAIYWSQSMYGLLGYQRHGEFLSFGEMNALIHPDDADLYAFAQELVNGGRNSFSSDFRARTASGDWLWLRARAEMVTDRVSGGKHLVGIAIDISEERAAAAKSATADMRLADAIESIPEAFVLWDAQQRLVTCNSKFQKLHQLPSSAVAQGLSYDEVMRQATPPVIAEDIMSSTDPETRSRLSEVKLGDGRWLQISERRTKDGGSVSVGTDVTLIKEHEHRLMDSERRLIATIADLKSSRRQLEAQAQQLTDLAERYLEQKAEAEMASKAKTEFLANMSHDLRTPLNAIIGFSDVMASGMFGTLGCDRHLGYCRDIKASGEHLLAIVDDILDMSRLETGQVDLIPQRVALRPVIAASLSMVKPPFEDKAITVEVKVADEVCAKADPRALRQVLKNILQNAAKFTPGGGHVSVRVKQSGEMLQVFVSDDGIGIPRSVVKQIGRPFEQVEGGETARSHKGSGLGLAISRALCELHGGALRLRSREGVGTVVMASFPMAETEPQLFS